jgi:hypothetical protein
MKTRMTRIIIYALFLEATKKDEDEVEEEKEE